MEALKGNQHKIDKNKNGKIDAHDFKLLQKEEESEDRMSRADYKESPSGRKSHKEIVFTSGEEDKTKETVKEEMTDAQMKKREEIVKSMKKDKAGFKDRYGDRAETVMYATATKMAMKEEAEELDEKSDQAKQNKTMKNMMDASRGARFKLNNPVPDAEPEHKNARAHNVAIGRALRKEEKKDDLPFTPDPVKKNPIAKAGKFGIGPSTAKHLAKMGMQQAMKKTVKEETDDSEKTEMAQTQLHFIKYAAEEILEYIEMGGKIEEWYQNKLSKVQSEVESLHSYIEGEKRRTGMVKEEIEEGMQQTLRKYVPGYANRQLNKKMDAQAYEKGDSTKKTVDKDVNYARYKKIADKLNKEEVEIEEQAPVAPVPGMKFKNHAVMVHPETKSRVVINRKNIDNYTSDGYKEVRPGQKLKEDEEVKFSYTELMMINEIKLADLPVRRIKGHSYGADYSDPEGADDYDDKKPMKPTAEKRGRGRPAGSQSGARKNFGSSKLHTK